MIFKIVSISFRKYIRASGIGSERKNGEKPYFSVFKFFWQRVLFRRGISPFYVSRRGKRSVLKLSEIRKISIHLPIFPFFLSFIKMKLCQELHRFQTKVLKSLRFKHNLKTHKSIFLTIIKSIQKYHFYPRIPTATKASKFDNKERCCSRFSAMYNTKCT